MSIFLDLDKGSLLGVRIGEKADEISISLEDKNKGYSIAVINGTVESIFVSILEGYSGFRSFAGEIKFKESKIYIQTSVSPNELKEAFGSPAAEWEDGVEKCLEYTTQKNHVEFVWGVEDRLHLKYVAIERS
ncbi:hypothetical protein [Thalassotalea sp. PS06]|uniref:hypothetical protein n=1 Tax=Thalassotalea sp. PS06 TaxID=2594005 RepID=UPI0011624A08|nr:hypothetical protein [Thalassotalea sp. PS06]QDP01560.1 hypothetical protein FNC98_09565 [Thalassotalea sp. PS06]